MATRPGRNPARRHARRSQGAGRRLRRRGIRREPTTGRRPKRVAMRKLKTISWIVAATILTAMLASAVAFRADAQSEYIRGDRMPYDAFDRMPKTDLEIGGGIIHVGFAPGEMTLPREKVLDWVRMSAKAVTAYYGRFPV